MKVVIRDSRVQGINSDSNHQSQLDSSCILIPHECNPSYQTQYLSNTKLLHLRFYQSVYNNLCWALFLCIFEFHQPTLAYHPCELVEKCLCIGFTSLLRLTMGQRRLEWKWYELQEISACYKSTEESALVLTLQFKFVPNHDRLYALSLMVVFSIDYLFHTKTEQVPNTS